MNLISPIAFGYPGKDQATSAPALLLRPRVRLAMLNPETLWDWACLRGQLLESCGSGTLKDAVLHHRQQPATPIALVVPGEDALALDLPLPPGKEAHCRAAAPFLMEDYLLEEVEAVHVALSVAGKHSARRAVAINAQCLMLTLRTLADAGLSVTFAWVDHELLAGGREAACCFRDGERLLLCAPGVPGFTGPREVAARWIEAQGAEALAANPVEVSGAAFFSALQWPAAGAAAVDLLQGRFEPAERLHARRKKHLQVVGAVSVLPITWMLFLVLLGWWHGHLTQVTRAEARELLAARHPELARAPSLERAVDVGAKLAAQVVAADAPDLGQLLRVLGASLAAQAAEERPQLTELHYQLVRGSLELRLEAGTVQALQALQSALAARGATSQLVSASRVGERFEGRVRVGHATP